MLFLELENMELASPFHNGEKLGLTEQFVLSQEKDEIGLPKKRKR